MIFRKSKTIKLKCYPSIPRMEEFFPIDYSRKLMPEWYKKLPSYVDGGKSTLKVCPGVNDYFGLGVTIPLWADHEIEYNENGIVHARSSLQREPGLPHPNYQWAGQFPGWAHIKLNNPWYFVTEELVKFVLVDCTWHKKDLNQYVIPTGTLEFKYQHHAHLQMFLPPNENFLSLQAGIPMATLIPLDDRPIDLEVHEYDENILNKIRNNYRFTFNNLYYKTRKLLEKK